VSCRCPKPATSVNPRRREVCGKCDHNLDPRWVSSDETMGEIFRRLAEAMPYGEAMVRNPMGGDEMTDDFMAFEAHCLGRERAGRDTFGFAYLDRENEVEALEEWADGANYLAMSYLRKVREEGDDDDFDLVLTIMRHAFKAHQATRQLRAKRHGAP
jgi:hypothetical protein